MVQGVAGSGKTTIALHRVAYLIYTYEEDFIPENFFIFAPNRLFINYISEVLPELGVERVKQTTFVDFMTNIIGLTLLLQDPSQKLVHIKCSFLKEQLERTGCFKINLVTGDEDAYSGGVVILRAYVAKGLEFDAVLILNNNEVYHSEELDIKLLYVAVTRARQELAILYKENTVSVLD